MKLSLISDFVDTLWLAIASVDTLWRPLPQDLVISGDIKSPRVNIFTAVPHFYFGLIVSQIIIYFNNARVELKKTPKLNIQTAVDQS